MISPLPPSEDAFAMCVDGGYIFVCYIWLTKELFDADDNEHPALSHAGESFWRPVAVVVVAVVAGVVFKVCCQSLPIATMLGCFLLTRPDRRDASMPHEPVTTLEPPKHITMCLEDVQQGDACSRRRVVDITAIC